MRIPFFHKEALVLFPSEGKVEWACLSTALSKEKRIETGILQFSEGIQWKDVAKFIAEKKWLHAQVVVGLNPLYVRYFLIQGPVIDTVEEFDRWMLNEVENQLPAGTESTDFVFRSRVLHQDEDSLRCLVGLVRRSTIENELALLHEAGIFPVKIAGLLPDLEALVRSHVFDMKHGYGLIVDDLESTCLSYQAGVLVQIKHFDGLGDDADWLRWRQSLVAAIMEAHSSPEQGELLISCNASVIQHLPTDELKTMGISCTPWNLSMADTHVEAKHFANCAMLTGLRKDTYELNFLGEEQVQEQINTAEKKLAMQVVLTGGALLAGMLALILIAQVFLSDRLVASQENLMLKSTQKSVLDKQNSIIKELEIKLRQAKRYVGERTAAANILTQLGKKMPENVWLDDLTMSSHENDQWSILLKGVALDKQDVAVLLGQLEQLEHVDEVELVLSETIPVRQLYKKEKLNALEVTRFDIVVRLPKAVHLSQPSNIEAS